MKHLLATGYLGALAALGAATCCVLPMALILLGLGGAWLAVFGTLAAYALPVLAASSVLIAAAWAIAMYRALLARLAWRLAGATVILGLAWGMYLAEARINQMLMTWM